MKNVVIGFSTSRNKFAVGSFLIRSVEGTKFSHVYLKDGETIWQESLPAFNEMSDVEFLNQETVIDEYVVGVTDEQYSDIIDFCEYCLRLRVPYGKLQIVGMSIVRSVNQLFHCHFKNPFANGPRTMVCSEFVGEVLRIIGVTISQDQLELEGPKFIQRLVIGLVDRTNQSGI